MATVLETHLFSFKGKNRRGEKIAGELRANNLIETKSHLRKQGIISTYVKKNLNRCLAVRRKLPRQILQYLPVNWLP